MDSSTSYHQHIDVFFSVLHQKRESHRQATQRLDRFLSTRFNVFNLLQPNELALSSILAELLNPDGVHGQGQRFLDSFVMRIGLNELRERRPWHVSLEKRTLHVSDSTRRIDIVVEYEGFGLGIENKPWAAEQERQVADYLHELHSNHGKHHCLVYLTPDGGRPSSVHDSECTTSLRDGRLVLLSYRVHVRAWLEECIHLCDSDKYRWFLRDFLEYVKDKFPQAPTLEVLHASG